MKHLKFFDSDFLNEDDINHICKKIIKTGYISKSLEGELIQTTGDNDIVRKMVRKVDKINSFFTKYSVDFLEEILLIFFEWDYDYEVHMGLYSPDRHRIWKNFEDKFIINNKEYKSFGDKRSYMISNILKLLSSMSQSAKRTRTEWKGRNKFSIPPDRNTNYFKDFMNVKPMIVVEIKHKEFMRCFEEELDGIRNRREFSDKIEKRLSYIPNANPKAYLNDQFAWRDIFIKGELMVIFNLD